MAIRKSIEAQINQMMPEAVLQYFKEFGVEPRGVHLMTLRENVRQWLLRPPHERGGPHFLTDLHISPRKRGKVIRRRAR